MCGRCVGDVEWFMCLNSNAQQCIQCLSPISTGVRHVAVAPQWFTMLLCIDRGQGTPALVSGSARDVDKLCKFF